MHEEIKITGYDKYGRLHTVIPLIHCDQLLEYNESIVSAELKVGYMKLKKAMEKAEKELENNFIGKKAQNE